MFLASPLLSRIFSLTQFGSLANFNAWVALLALLSCLRYEHAIIIAKDTESTNRVLALTLTLSGVSVLLYTALGIGAFMWVRSGYLAEVRDIILFVPLGVLWICVSSPLIQLHVKAGRFKRLGVVAGLQALVIVLSQVVLGLIGVTQGLIVGTIMGSVFAAIMLAPLVIQTESFRAMPKAFRWRQLYTTALEFANFPRFTLVADALNVISKQFAPVLILALFGPAIAGAYAFAIRVMRVPVIVVSTAVANVLRKEGVDRLANGASLHALFRSTVQTLAIAAILPLVIVLAVGADLFTAVFGERWHEAGRIVQILSPGVFLEFVAFPLSVFLLITNNQRYTFRIQVLAVGLLVGALTFGHMYFATFRGTCYLITIAMLIANAVSIAVTDSRLKEQSP